MFFLCWRRVQGRRWESCASLLARQHPHPRRTHFSQSGTSPAQLHCTPTGFVGAGLCWNSVTYLAHATGQMKEHIRESCCILSSTLGTTFLGNGLLVAWRGKGWIVAEKVISENTFFWLILPGCENFGYHEGGPKVTVAWIIQKSEALAIHEIIIQ